MFVKFQIKVSPLIVGAGRLPHEPSCILIFGSESTILNLPLLALQVVLSGAPQKGKDQPGLKARPFTIPVRSNPVPH